MDPTLDKSFMSRLEVIFTQATQLARDERSRFVENECGNDRVLLEHVTRLVQGHENSPGEFILDRPICQLPDRNHSATNSVPAKAGDRIGRYKLLEKIGEGGMGVVFRAQQWVDVEREVALKIIKLGMDTRQVIARFEVERRALARFDHPNITTVLDAGATETGRSYFVMELVRGEEISVNVSNHALSLRQRLELFETVCHAVQHAHQKGIIHRDLKPSNILVSDVDQKPSPKIIDFGIAKALEQDQSSNAPNTHFSAIMGTPQYMSPEQALGGARDIDTRSDIYSLGIILFELITGSTPLTKETVKELNPIELLDTIRKHEFEAPSVRLENLESGKTPSGLDPWPATPVNRIKGPLDCIVMKALSLDRSQRYSSATEFATDINRFLNGDPVSAVPPTRLYRLKTYVSKRRKTVGVAIAIVLLLLTSSTICIGFAIQSYRANQNKDRLVLELKTAFEQLETNHKELTKTEKKIRRTAEDQLYQMAISLTFAQLDESFHYQVTQFSSKTAERPTHLNLETPNEFDKTYYDQYCRALIKLEHHSLVEPAMHRLDSVLNKMARNSSPKSEQFMGLAGLESHRRVKIIEQTVGVIQVDFFNLLLHNYRNAFGTLDPRVADALNLQAAALIEANRVEEAAICVREALMICGAPKSRSKVSALRLQALIQETTE